MIYLFMIKYVNTFIPKLTILKCKYIFFILENNITITELHL